VVRSSAASDVYKRQTLKSASIFPDVKHSDHCPIFVELSL
jgi:exonuclease III